MINPWPAHGIPDSPQRFANSLGMIPKTTPLQSPQSNGMAEPFVRTIKRDHAYVYQPCPDAQTVLRSLQARFTHYHEIVPHKTRGYRSPYYFVRAMLAS